MIEILAKYNYWIVIILLTTGLYGVMARRNLSKKIIGLNVFETALLLF
jgi:multicomponent Na+:H+ antiporter subunit C